VATAAGVGRWSAGTLFTTWDVVSFGFEPVQRLEAFAQVPVSSLAEADLTEPPRASPRSSSRAVASLPPSPPRGEAGSKSARR
jgi:hypothetical protein